MICYSKIKACFKSGGKNMWYGKVYIFKAIIYVVYVFFLISCVANNKM